MIETTVPPSVEPDWGYAKDKLLRPTRKKVFFKRTRKIWSIEIRKVTDTPMSGGRPSKPRHIIAERCITGWMSKGGKLKESITPAERHMGSPSNINWHRVLTAYSLTYIDRGNTTLTLGLHVYPEGAALGLISVSWLTMSESYNTRIVLLLAISYWNSEWEISRTEGPVKSDFPTEGAVLPAETSSDHSGGTNNTIKCPLLTVVVITLQNKPLTCTVTPLENDDVISLSTLIFTTMPTWDAPGLRSSPLAGTGHADGLMPAAVPAEFLKGIRSSASIGKQSDL
jgi:hypothetical protein